MTITKTGLAASLLIAGLLALGNAAMAKEHSIQVRELGPCKVHGRNVKDCHIHDQEAFVHLRPSDAKLAGPHADNEHRMLRRAARQDLRD